MRPHQAYSTNWGSRRLSGCDYTAAGWYFVTTCTKGRVAYFGEVRNGIMGLNEAGCTAHACWAEIPKHVSRVVLDAFIVMPDHIHGLIGLVADNDRAYPIPRPLPHTGSLSAVVGAYKSAVTRAVRRMGRTEFAWQPRFHDHIVRDERAFERIRRYIADNPCAWAG